MSKKEPKADKNIQIKNLFLVKKWDNSVARELDSG